MRTRLLTAAIALAAGGALAGAAQAQPAYVSAYDDVPTVGEVVVTPYHYRHYRAPPGVNRLSQVVSYADLDLATYEGRRMLDLRIRATARDICRALGEGPGNGSAIVPSCEDQAVRDARPQVRYAINQAYAQSVYASLEPSYRYAPY